MQMVVEDVIYADQQTARLEFCLRMDRRAVVGEDLVSSLELRNLPSWFKLKVGMIVWLPDEARHYALCVPIRARSEHIDELLRQLDRQGLEYRIDYN